MGWTLTVPTATASKSPTTFTLASSGTVHIVTTAGTAGLGVVTVLTTKLKLNTELGRITVGPWGAKLEAVDDTLSILSGQFHRDVAAQSDPRNQKYELKPRTDEHSEVILIRHGDVISATKATTTLTCKWDDSEVQVNSSAAEVKASADARNGVAEIPQDNETEDEGLDNTVVAVSATQAKSTQAKSQQSRGTPALSNQRSLVVQETPTVDRVSRLAGYPEQQEPIGSTEITSSPAVAGQTEELSLTAHTGELQIKAMNITGESGDEAATYSPKISTPASTPGPIGGPYTGSDGTSDYTPRQLPTRHPQMLTSPRPSRKRRSPTIDERETDDSEAIDRSNKRMKRAVPNQDDTQDSRISNIVVDKPVKSAPPTRRKNRAPEVHETASAEETPLRLQRSSQRSNTITVEAYDGPAPRVAFSNSAIALDSQAVRFLKKYKGAVEDSITDKCNVLCVRVGALTKTMKLLESIARGIPVVTDKWLIDSAKVGHFVALSEYQPSVPEQEKEWDFQLDKVWGKSQSPFQGYTIYFTPDLQKSYADFNEIKQVCKTVGAKVATKKPTAGESSIILAKNKKDAGKHTQDDVTCYSKDLLTNSILRGEVDLNSNEFIISSGDAASAPIEIEPPKGKKKKKGRNS